VILAPNHFSFFDHFFVAVLLRREVQFMAKSQLFRPPFLDFILSHGGTFPVRRGQRDEEAFITAHSILGHGGAVLMYAEGGRSRTKELGKPRPGIGRLALESGVPVVPIAIHGSEHVREASRLHVPKVTVQYGEPFDFPQVAAPSKEQSQEAAEQIFARVRKMYEALRAQGRRGVLAALRRERRQGAPVTG
jgi:1-acyl-sn-glycerol-3-phosphate acyltransferase